MKKLIPFILILCLLLCACGKEETNQTDPALQDSVPLFFNDMHLALCMIFGYNR